MNIHHQFCQSRFCVWATVLIALFVGNAVFGQPAQLASVESQVIWQYLKADMAAWIKQGWRKTLDNLSVGGRPLSIAGGRFERGLGTHAPGKIFFKLGQQHRRFIAVVGVGDGADARSSVVFQVLLDGKKRSTAV